MLVVLRKLVSDDRGGEDLEYALIAGFIIIAVIAVLWTVGDRAIGR
jgi:Flp pilus assembly pilin Flp